MICMCIFNMIHISYVGIHIWCHTHTHMIGLRYMYHVYGCLCGNHNFEITVKSFSGPKFGFGNFHAHTHLLSGTIRIRSTTLHSAGGRDNRRDVFVGLIMQSIKNRWNNFFLPRRRRLEFFAKYASIRSIPRSCASMLRRFGLLRAIHSRVFRTLPVENVFVKFVCRK